MRADRLRVVRSACPAHHGLDQLVDTGSRLRDAVTHVTPLDGLLEPSDEVLPLRAAAHETIVPSPQRTSASPRPPQAIAHLAAVATEVGGTRRAPASWSPFPAPKNNSRG
jgi:hypothetical protein